MESSWQGRALCDRTPPRLPHSTLPHANPPTYRQHSGPPLRLPPPRACSCTSPRSCRQLQQVDRQAGKRLDRKGRRGNTGCCLHISQIVSSAAGRQAGRLARRALLASTHQARQAPRYRGNLNATSPTFQDPTTPPPATRQHNQPTCARCGQVMNFKRLRLPQPVRAVLRLQQQGKRVWG
jgi:hypothetical protein